MTFKVEYLKSIFNYKLTVICSSFVLSSTLLNAAFKHENIFSLPREKGPLIPLNLETVCVKSY